jgi:ribosomal protein S18 acetylase RimI-like enzyme
MIIVVPASADALAAIRSAYDSARQVQRARSESVWPEFSDESIVSQIDAGCLFCVVDGEEFLAVFTVAHEDRLIWGDRERGAHLYLHRIARTATSAGRGIVDAVLSWARAECRRLGRDGLRLDTWANNPKLVALYERHGFHLVGSRRMGIEPGLSPHYHGIELALLEAPRADWPSDPG